MPPPPPTTPSSPNILSDDDRPLSPPPLRLAPKPSIRRSRSSLTSIKKMPMIREDDAPILMSLNLHPPSHSDGDDDGCRRRSRAPRTSAFYQYGEDYITPWHLVGVCPSPAPRVGRAGQTERERRHGGGSGGAARGSTSEDSSDWEPDEEGQGQGLGLHLGKHDGVVRTTAAGVVVAARRGPWRRLCESRYWSWR